MLKPDHFENRLLFHKKPVSNRLPFATSPLIIDYVLLSFNCYVGLCYWNERIVMQICLFIIDRLLFV